MLSHLKNNVVGYLALVVALSGTSYAAVQLSAGQVKTRHIANKAVTAKKIRPGVVKNARVLAASTRHSISQVGDPPATWESPGSEVSFTVPRKGRVLIQHTYAELGVSCTSGLSYYGLWVDGNPVPGTLANTAPSGEFAKASTLVASLALPKGPHSATVGFVCPTGTPQSFSLGPNNTWTVLLIG